MISKAFVQYDYNTGLPSSESGYAICRGCYWQGIEVEKFYLPADIRTKVHRDTLVHGGVSAVKSSLRYLGVQVPEVPDAPECLLPWFGRKIWESSMADIRNRKTSEPVFIKPLKLQKSFIGCVYTGSVTDLIQTADIPDDMELLCSEPVKFISEYRILVHNRMIYDCRFYAGDPTLFPNISMAQEAIRAFDDQPCGYSLDIGVVESGETLIVEVNDAFALGNYGAAYLPYTNMVIDRWKEIVR